MQEIIIIAAMAENRVIGRDNALPWSLKEDMARFRELTNGWPCIMGRKTWESLPKRPLPGRLNIVISRSLAAEAAHGAIVFPSLRRAIRYCAEYAKIFICGGASIYYEALGLANRIELTVIHSQYEGDAFFPGIDDALWIKTGAVDFDGFSFISYSKKHERSNPSRTRRRYGKPLRRP
jgi:dihydrofolate reductase